MLRRVLRPLQHPARLLPASFALVILLGTGLLMLPAARSGPGGADVLTALFTATSAVCVTGLTVVDTGIYWTWFGQLIILLLVAVGGFGITALATLVVLSVAGRLGLRTRMAAQKETKTLELGEVGRVLVRVAMALLVLQAAVATVLTARFLAAGERFGQAAWDGLFHAVSASNNAGFSLYSDSLTRYIGDPVVVLTVCIAIVVGGLGFPVIVELVRSWRQPRRWSLHTKLTLSTTVVLLLAGLAVMVAFEWSNPGTLGRLDVGSKLLGSIFHAVQPRTAGFNVVDITDMRQETLLSTVILMFIGGGSASTAGGIKVTTVAILVFVVLAEVRGDADTTVARRRIAPETQRQAVGITLVGLTAVVAGSLVIMSTTQVPFGPAVFEATSAFGTVGLSLGFDAELPTSAQLALVALMFIGRVGPIAAFSFFALRTHRHRFRYAEARPLVG